MKVAATLICVECDEVLEDSVSNCPACTGTKFLSLHRIIRPLQSVKEMKDCRVAVTEKEGL